MTKSKQKPIDTSGFPELLSVIGGQSMNSFSDAYWRWVKNANVTSSELLRFVKERFNKDMQLMARFIECEKPEDFLALQSEAVTSMIGDYAEEGSKLFDMLVLESEDGCANFGMAMAPTKAV